MHSHHGRCYVKFNTRRGVPSSRWILNKNVWRNIALAASIAPLAACSSSKGSGGTPDGGGTNSSDGSSDDAAPAFGEQCPTGSVFAEDFSSAPSSRWQIVAGQWQASPGIYAAVGGSPDAIVSLGPRSKWTNYRIETRLRIDGGSGNGGVIFCVQDVASQEDGGAPPDNAGAMYWGGVWGAQNEVMLGYMDGTYNSLGNGAATLTVGQWYDLKVEVVGSSIAIYLDGNLIEMASDARYTSGSIGLRTWNLQMSYSAVTVTCL